MTKLALGTRIFRKIHQLGPSAHKIMGNMGWLMFDRVFRMGMGLFVGVWVTRYLGPVQFGSLSFAISFIALFGMIATLGLDTIVIREIVDSPSNTYEILGTTLALRTLGAVATVVIVVGAVRLMLPGDHMAILLVSTLSISLIFNPFDTIDLFFQSQVQSKVTVWARNLSFVVFAGIRVFLIKTNAHVLAFAVVTVAESAMITAALLIGYKFMGGRVLAWRISKARAIQLLKLSWPVMFSGIAITLYMRLDMVMLKMMKGDLAVGLYSVVNRVSEVWYFIPMAIVSSVSPAIMRAKTNPEVYYSRIRNLFSIMTFMACFIGFGVALASHFIIRILYANLYSAAAPILAVHIWSSVFVFLGCAQSPWDNSEKLLNLALYRTMVGAIINVGMNLVLIPRYSAMGAAISTVVSYAIAGVFANAFHPKTRPIFYMQLQSFIPRKFWVAIK